jgi:hypothetical protein
MSHSTSMSESGSGSAGSRRVHRITESASGSPDATPSENGSDKIGISAIVLVVVAADVDGGTAVVVGAIVVEDGGPVVSGAPEVVVEAACSSPSLHAARAAAIVPARNPRRVSRVGLLSSIADLRSPCRSRIVRRILVGRRASRVTAVDQILFPVVEHA